MVTKKGRTNLLDPGSEIRVGNSGSGMEEIRIRAATLALAPKLGNRNNSSVPKVRIKWRHHSWIPHLSVCLYHGPNIYKDTKP
jgi:hypothetical protein